MRYFAPLLVLMVLGAMAGAPVSVSAQPYGPRQGVQSGEVRSLGEILDNVRRERPGNLADVQGPDIGPQGEPHYRLKWVSPDGRVQWLDTDARTGRVLSARGAEPGPRGPGAFPTPGGPRPRGGGFGPRRDNFGAPIVGGPPRGPGGGFGRGPRPGPGPGFGRGPGPGGGFGRGPGPGPNRGPGGGFGNRFRPGR